LTVAVTSGQKVVHVSSTKTGSTLHYEEALEWLEYTTTEHRALPILRQIAVLNGGQVTFDTNKGPFKELACILFYDTIHPEEVATT
jgi:hypothetical protein